MFFEKNMDSQWEIANFALKKDGSYKCLIPNCNFESKSQKKFNFSRHYESVHKAMYDNIHGQPRVSLYNFLKRNNSTEFENNDTNIDTIKLASYILAYQILKNKRPFTDADFVKECSIKIAETIGESGTASKLQKIPSSRRTISRRCKEIGVYFEKELHKLIESSVFVSIQLDESTDVTGLAELLIFVRMVFDNFECQEELLDLVAMTGNTRGSDFFDALDDVVWRFKIKDKISLICTDGCPAMLGEKDGLVGLLKQNGYKCQCLHCLIHRFSLASKVMNHEYVMKFSVLCTKKIRGGKKSLRRRKFRKFLMDKKAPHRELSLYTEVRWLSRGEFLHRFFELLPYIKEFITEIINDAKIKISDREKSKKRKSKTKKQDKSTEKLLIDEFQPILNEISSIDFEASLAFLTDMMQHINKFNLRLQGKNQTIGDLVGHIDAFTGIV